MTTPVSRRERVLLVDSHISYAELLEMTLNGRGYKATVIPIPDQPLYSDGVLATLLMRKPQTVILDLELGRYTNGMDLIEPLARRGFKVIVLTGVTDPARHGQAVHHGARKVITKDRSITEIMSVLRRVTRGHSVMDVDEYEELMRTWWKETSSRKEALEKLEKLSIAERDVLMYLTSGLSVPEIARTRTTSEATVRTQTQSILRKLGVKSQHAAVCLAHNAGWAAQSRSA